MAIFSLCPHVVKSRERGLELSISSYEGTNPVHEGFTLMAYSPPKGPSS